MHSLCKKYSSKKRQRVLLIQGGERCCGRTGERTPLVPLQACAGWQRASIATPIRASFCRRTGACRSLSQPLFRVSRNQGVTRCNTLDFASKVVCQRGAAAPLETQEKRPSTTLLVLGQCADPLAHSLDQRNDKRIPHGEIAQSFRHPGCPIIREAVEPFAFDGR